MDLLVSILLAKREDNTLPETFDEGSITCSDWPTVGEEILARGWKARQAMKATHFRLVWRSRDLKFEKPIWVLLIELPKQRLEFAEMFQMDNFEESSSSSLPSIDGNFNLVTVADQER